AASADSDYAPDIAVDDDSKVAGCVLETGNEEDTIHDNDVAKTDLLPTEPASPTDTISVDSENDVPSDTVVDDDAHLVGYAPVTGNEEDNEDVQNERRMLAGFPPSLIHVAQYDAVVDPNLSTTSDQNSPASSMMGAGPLSGSTGGARPSSRAQIPAPTTSTVFPDRQAHTNPNPANIICPTSAKMIADMMSLFNNQMNVMVEEIRSLKEQVSK
ncbi:hypothetical protein PENTCL1PPCAC_30110, partial [Pristionchus entomophagus]